MGALAYSAFDHQTSSKQSTSFSKCSVFVISITRRFRHYHNIWDVLQQMLLNGRSKQEQVMVMRAYEFAKEKHRGKMRTDEETLYINHLLEVAHKVASWGYGRVAVSTALLHDAPEDANVKLSEISAHFDPTVAYLVGLLTKPKLHEGVWIYADSKKYYEVKGERGRNLYNQKSDAYYNSLFNAGSLTTLVIKFADSLQNLEEIVNLPEWKRMRNVATMVKHLVKLGEKIIQPTAFLDFKARLLALGFDIYNENYDKTIKPVVVLPHRSNISRYSLDTFRQPDLDHLTLYEPNARNIFELGLPSAAALLDDRALLSVLRTVFSERFFVLSRNKSLLPQQMAGHEKIIGIRPIGSIPLSVDEIKYRSIELFSRLRPMLEAAML